MLAASRPVIISFLIEFLLSRRATSSYKLSRETCSPSLSLALWPVSRIEQCPVGNSTEPWVLCHMRILSLAGSLSLDLFSVSLPLKTM